MKEVHIPAIDQHLRFLLFIVNLQQTNEENKSHDCINILLCPDTLLPTFLQLNHIWFNFTLLNILGLLVSPRLQHPLNDIQINDFPA